ncbi:MAG TPA: NAD(P)-dependent oxidoreductase [Spirochaetia bacterium]|nr:NAD(P)-dependent oxidoreductase [Spirochaetia bacterium]
MLTTRRVLVTGANGKLGGPLCRALVDRGYEVTAIEHHSPVDLPGVRPVRLELSDYRAVEDVVAESDAIIHLASAKENREAVVDLSVRGTFNLLDASLRTRKPKRFLLAGGDCVNGIYYQPHTEPISEKMAMGAYPGYYALSKVLEETLTTQYYIQEKVPIVNLRMSWIHAEDDILNHLCTNGEPFGVPVWTDLMSEDQLREFHGERNAAVIAVHPDGKPLIRHIVAIEDCVDAFLIALEVPGIEGETFNIAMNAPFDYRDAAEHAAEKLGIEVLELVDPVGQDYYVDIAKARYVLGFSPKLDIHSLIEQAIEFRHSGAQRRTRTGYKG